jgi:5'(3')-deoxyribonucleotidase
MKKIIYIDLDGVICDFEKAFKQSQITNPQQPYPQSSWGFFSTLEPIEGAIESIKKLQENFDVWIASAPSVYNLNCYTEKAFWVRQNLGFEMQSKLILITNKSLLKGNFLIDNEINKFDGKLIHFGSEKFPNWNSVLELLEQDSRSGHAKIDPWYFH